MIPDEGRPAIHPPFPEQPLPASGCVLWRPAVQELARPDTDPCIVFVAPRVIAAVEDQLHSGPNQGLVGFLVGRVLTNPATGFPYVVIDRAMPVPQLSVAGGSDRLVTQSLAAVQRMVQPADGGAELVGWYRTQPSGEPRISAEDHDAHVRSFPHPWHVALVVAGGRDGPKGGLFRPASDPGSPVPYLPFFELVEGSGDQNMSNSSVVSWTNYWSPNPGRRARRDLTLDRWATPAGRVPTRGPHSEITEQDRPNPRRDEPDRAWRWWVAAAVVVIVATVTVEEWWLHRESLPSEVVTATDSGGARPAGPAVTAEPVRRAIAAYRQRATLFANRQMTCADLAPGLADVDDEWLRYVRAAPPALDRTLATEVEAVEADFERTGCPRP